MLRHVVLLHLRPDAPAGRAAEIADALRRLPETVGSIRSYEVGLDAGLADGNADVVVIADFDDPDGFRSYRDHPDHVRVIEELIAPALAQRSAVQFERP